MASRLQLSNTFASAAAQDLGLGAALQQQTTDQIAEAAKRKREIGLANGQPSVPGSVDPLTAAFSAILGGRF
jgi:hypothetical protein